MEVARFDVTQHERTGKDGQEFTVEKEKSDVIGKEVETDNGRDDEEEEEDTLKELDEQDRLWRAITSEILHSSTCLRDFSRLHPNANLNEIVVYSGKKHGEKWEESFNESGAENEKMEDEPRFKAGMLLPYCYDQSASHSPETDFVATDRELKKMFELSLSPESTSCSLLVQRVGNVLVLDGTWNGEVADISEEVAVNDENPLVSKFLFYSVKEAHSISNDDDDEESMASDLSEHRNSPSSTRKSRKRGAARLRQHGFVTVSKDKSIPLNLLDESEDEQPLGFTKSDEFRRVVRWRVGDFNLILGSDLLIFKDEEHQQYMSLRLRDVQDSFSAKVCLDTWLDNKINGADSTAICFHKEGIVQGYQIISNKELLVRPDLVSGKKKWFRPKAISDGACNIMSFLKRHCQEDGATYYLSKKKDSTDLCLFQLLKGNSTENSTKVSSGVGGEADNGDKQRDKCSDQDFKRTKVLAGPIASLYLRLSQRLLDEDSTSEQAESLLLKAVAFLDKHSNSVSAWLSGSYRRSALQLSSILASCHETLGQIYIRRAQQRIVSEELNYSFNLIPTKCGAVDIVNLLEFGAKRLASALDCTLRLLAARRQRLPPAGRSERKLSSSATEEEDNDASAQHPEDETEECGEILIDGDRAEVVEKRLRKTLFLCYIKIGLRMLETGASGRMDAALRCCRIASQLLDNESSERNGDFCLFLAASILTQWYFNNCSEIGLSEANLDQEQLDKTFSFVQVDLSECSWLFRDRPAFTASFDFMVGSVMPRDQEETLQLLIQVLVRCLTTLRMSSVRRALLSREFILDFLFDSYSALGKLYASTGRITKSFRHWNQGVEFFKGLRSEPHSIQAKLELILLNSQLRCGVDLMDPDVVRPLTLLAVVTDAESSTSVAGLSGIHEASCSLDPTCYKEQMAAFESLLWDAQTCLRDQRGHWKTLEQIKTLFVIASIRYAVVASRCGDLHDALRTLEKTAASTQSSDLVLQYRLEFALGLVSSARIANQLSSRVQEVTVKRIWQHYESALSFLSKAGDSKISSTDRLEIGLDGLAIRGEGSLCMVQLWESLEKPKQDIGRLTEQKTNFHEHPTRYILSEGALFVATIGRRGLSVELDALISASDEAKVHLQALRKTASKCILELFKSNPSSADLRDAYKLSLGLVSNGPVSIECSFVEFFEKVTKILEPKGGRTW